MTPRQALRVRIMDWVRETHGSEWYYSIARDGTINGRRTVRGRRFKEHKVLGNVNDIPENKNPGQ